MQILNLADIETQINLAAIVSIKALPGHAYRLCLADGQRIDVTEVNTPKDYATLKAVTGAAAAKPKPAAKRPKPETADQQLEI